jgi:hypothetical protein
MRVFIFACLYFLVISRHSCCSCRFWVVFFRFAFFSRFVVVIFSLHRVRFFVGRHISVQRTHLISLSSFIHHHSSSPGVHPHRRIAFTRRRCPSRWPSGRPLRRLLMSTTRSFWKTDDDDDDDDDDMMTSVSRNNKRLLAKGFWFNRGRERGFKTRTTVTTSTLPYLVVVFVHQLMHALLFLLVLLPRHPRAKLTGLLLHALAPPRAKVAGAVARGVRGDVGVQHGVPAWRQLLQESKV